MSFQSILRSDLQQAAIQKAFSDRGLGDLFKQATLGTATEWMIRQPVNLAEASGHALKSFAENNGVPALAGTAAVGLGLYGANAAVDQVKANLAASQREGTYIPGGY